MQLTDLKPLRGSKLKALWIYASGVTDLTPLEGIELENIKFTPRDIAKGIDVLRKMTSLKTVGPGQVWPAAEFWQRYDKGAFK